jgi:plastocyanin
MKRRILLMGLVLFFLILAALACPPAAGSEITGKVRVMGRAPRAEVTTIVYAERLDSRIPAGPKHFKLLQKNKSFSPRVLAVPTGSSVEFTNQDLIFHNVFSLSPPGPFDLGLYRAGQSKTRTFGEPALYRVFCNIHPQMTALILVVPTPYIAEADAAGAYRLDLPPGRYRLTAWSERAKEAIADVTVSSEATTAPDLALDESKFVELPHKNKYGEEYPKAAYEDKKP